MITIYSESINIINHLEKIYENGRHGHVRNVNLQLPMTELWQNSWRSRSSMACSIARCARCIDSSTLPASPAAMGHWAWVYYGSTMELVWDWCGPYRIHTLLISTLHLRSISLLSLRFTVSLVKRSKCSKVESYQIRFKSISTCNPSVTRPSSIRKNLGFWNSSALELKRC